jgi:hypothetical protein
MTKMTLGKSLTALVLTTVLAAPAFAASGFIALEGSDATTFHQDPQYTPQLFKYLQGGSSKDVLVFMPGGGPNPGPTGVSVTTVTSLAGVNFSNYSALYVESGGGCCTADPTALDGYGAAVSAFVTGGGNVSIENYIGGGYDGVVPGGTGAIQGVNVSFTGCSDGETVTANGISKGFTQPPVDFCWSHQGYDMNYFSTFGYNSLIKSDPVAYGFANGSSFLATGGTLGTSGTPEPETWALMLVGFGGVGAVMRRRATKVVLA